MRCGCYAHDGFRRSPEGLAERRDVSPEGVDMGASQLYLDIPGSVSGSRRDEIKMIFDEEILDEQHRRFLKQVVG